MEEVIIAKAIHRISGALNIDQKIEIVNGQIAFVNNSIEGKIIEKVTELFNENLDELIPTLPKMKK